MRGLYTKTNDYYSSFLISNIRHISSATSKSFWFGREISWLKSFPGGTSGEKPACQCRRRKRHGFDPEAWKNWCFQINAIIAQVFSADLFCALIWKLPLERSLLYGQALISIHDYGKNHSFDSMDFCQQSGIYFLIHYLGMA